MSLPKRFAPCLVSGRCQARLQFTTGRVYKSITLHYKVYFKLRTIALVMACWFAVFFIIIEIGENNVLLHLATFLAVPMVTIVACILYAVIERPKQSSRHIVATLIKYAIVVPILIIASEYFTYAAHWLLWDPIDCPGDSGLVTDTVLTSGNGKGDVTVVRRSVCEVGFFAGSDAYYYFVFVHPLGQPNATGNLVLRFDTDERGYNRAPRVQWFDEKTVRVVAEGSVVFVVSQRRPQVGNIRIFYQMPRSEYPDNITAWQRLSTSAI